MRMRANTSKLTIVIDRYFSFPQSLTLMVELPFSRELETEADEVGLMLAAAACYDIRKESEQLIKKPKPLIPLPHRGRKDVGVGT